MRTDGARLCRTSKRGHQDRDDGRQDPDGKGAQYHHLDVYQGMADGSVSELSGSV